MMNTMRQTILILVFAAFGSLGFAQDEEPAEVTPAALTPTPVVTETPAATPTPDESDEMILPDPDPLAGSPTPTPTPSPTAILTPLGTPRPTPVPIRFLPPLSLRDTIERIDRALNVIPPDYSSDGPEDIPVDSLSRMIESAYNYLRLRNDLHTTLANYEWVEMEKAGVDHQPGLADHDTFFFQPPMQKISSLSFEAFEGDVQVHYLQIWDEKGQVRETYDTLRERPRTLLHSLPRREVFHLWRRTTISRIDIDYSRVDQETEPEVILYGGITERQEFIKTALHHLGHAQPNIRTGNWFAARSDLLNARDAVDGFLQDVFESNLY